VSRGIGTSLLPVRLGATPELAVIDWDPARA
jgi:predicted MPP superfamily phosphohydrolase